MPQLLTLSRAARLLGTTRGALQKKIKDGNLPSFDGMIATEDLFRLYPDTKFKEDLVLERLAKIKDEAFARRIRERVLPDKEILAARLYEQSRELADVRTHLQRYHSIIMRTLQRLRGYAENPALQELDAWLNHQLQEVLNTEAPNEITVMDDYLRVVSAHVLLTPSHREFFVNGADTVLEAGLRSGIALNYGCSGGTCGLCKARIVSGQITKVRPHDYVLSEAEKNMGYALLCSCTAVTDLVIETLEATSTKDIPQQEIQARVKSVEPLTDKVMLLHLQTPRSNRLRFFAGQRAALSIGETGAADYAIASCPCDDRNLQFHIRDIPGDEFARRVFDNLKTGDNVTVQGPSGEFVLHEDSTRPLLFIACNSGFAPIKSLIEHAMALDNAESMHLYWFATFPTAHYLSNLCRSWTDALDNFHYTELSADSLDAASIQNVPQQILRDHPSLGEFDVYLAGPEAFITPVRNFLFSNGLPQTQLTTDMA